MDIDLTHNGVDIQILDGPYVEGGSPTDRAVGDYTDLVARLEELKGFAADKLLDLYNSDWRTDEIGDVDRAGFIARLSNSLVSLCEPGFAIVYFDDGDLFGGHSIEIHVEKGSPNHAGIAG